MISSFCVVCRWFKYVEISLFIFSRFACSLFMTLRSGSLMWMLGLVMLGGECPSIVFRLVDSSGICEVVPRGTCF